MKLNYVGIYLLVISILIMTMPSKENLLDYLQEGFLGYILIGLSFLGLSTFAISLLPTLSRVIIRKGMSTINNGRHSSTPKSMVTTVKEY